MAPLTIPSLVLRSLPNDHSSGSDPSDSRPATSHRALSTGAAIAISVIAVVLLLLIISFGAWTLLRSRKQRIQREAEERRAREDLEMKTATVEGDADSGWEVVVGEGKISRRD